MAAIFAYGSLLAPATIAALVGHPPTAGRDYRRARVPGWSRTWNVCTDNTANGPVVYEDPSDGSRPAIQVLFLTIDPGTAVDGVLIHLPDAGLPALDAREGNYRRIPVEVDDHGPAWTYVAKPESAARARLGIAAGTARIRQDYVDTVLAACAAHDGLPALAPLPAPVVTLRRILR
ncbi:gamma-glutamylcyclotransferase family protein [Paractinoplanes globisporus]|uniref:Gamma-glutamylcyclotransferase family protein n=1 Tax=Paractinoplanes globisporus TaxID=113565 RepID=A0ABW6WC44_9ACTN|nr:gamma-glutamylcyclotransferase family protein [Actinoplanes globisporus]